MHIAKILSYALYDRIDRILNLPIITTTKNWNLLGKSVEFEWKTLQITN